MKKSKYVYIRYKNEFIKKGTLEPEDVRVVINFVLYTLELSFQTLILLLYYYKKCWTQKCTIIIKILQIYLDEWMSYVGLPD